MAFIGIVYKARKDLGKDKIIVYGVTTDSEVFNFYRLDKNGKVRRTVYNLRFSWI
jgi:hypothetical protein